MSTGGWGLGVGDWKTHVACNDGSNIMTIILTILTAMTKMITIMMITIIKIIIIATIMIIQMILLHITTPLHMRVKVGVWGLMIGG